MSGPFPEDLAIELALTWAGGAHKAPAGRIRDLSLRCTTVGFEAEASFFIEDRGTADPLVAQFEKPDLLEAALTVGLHYKSSGSETAQPLLVSGIVGEKRFAEMSYAGVSGAPVLVRLFTVKFADPAAVLWRQHFPTELFVDKSMKDVLTAHAGEKVTLAYDWAAVLDVAKPVLCLGLGDERNEASFYDLVLWYTHARNGVFTYDAALSSYKLTAAKPELADAVPLQHEDVAALEVHFPETPRHAVAVLNADADTAGKEDVTQEKSVAGVRRDVLIRAAVAADKDARKTLETARLKLPEAEAEVTFRRFPRVAPLPNAAVAFSAAAWPSSLWIKTKTFRVRELTLRARTESTSPRVDPAPTAGFTVELSARLESQADVVVRYPPFRAPRYPIYLEGRILSEQGEDADETYQVYKDAAKADRYKVKIPLFADQVVIAPFNGNQLPGHFYFPAVKKARVLVGFDLESAWVKRFLDWRLAAAVPPADSQGNQIVFGKTATNRTLVSHLYADAKPTLSIARINDKDTELLELGEGVIVLQTKEEK